MAAAFQLAATNVADNRHLDWQISQIIAEQPFEDVEASEFYLVADATNPRRRGCGAEAKAGVAR
ncbi:MAG TPA: hypothetical protein VG826_05965 [Pirellulales bacterium]|nr:hypothetical protein [Pirellulales bacterium]